ncbi:MAG: SLBB domain-containing protein, partial [Candidatus Riflebacteria bacterium]
MKKQGNAGRQKAKYLLILASLISLLNSNLFLNFLSSHLSLRVANASSGKGVLFGDSLKPYGHGMMESLLQKIAQRDQSCGPQKEISVCVVGEVAFPGQYELCPPATVLTGFAAAGGPGLQGSTRFIKVFNGDFCQTFDLYDYYSSGKDVTTHLVGAETLVVEKKNAVIRISGEVCRPAIFELLPQEMIAAKVLEMAGGLIPEAGVRVRFDLYREAGDSVCHLISREFDRSELAGGLAALKL